MIEYVAPEDPYLDFCLWPYPPPVVSGRKLRSISLLALSFEICGVAGPGRRVVEALQQAVGPFTTVWGLKWVDGVMRWELYFYDYRRLERERSITRVLDALRPIVPCDVTPDEGRPYFMFSLDLTVPMLRGQNALEEVHVYVGNVGSTVSSGICYSATRHGTTLENIYFFFDAAREMEQIVGKMCCSAHLDLAGVDVDAILWPELKDCQTIVVANKRFSDGIYFSRIDVDQLRVALKRFDYPQPLVAFVDKHRDELDHLKYDVGFDYRLEGGRLRFLKSGFYGIF